MECILVRVAHHSVVCVLALLSLYTYTHTKGIQKQCIGRQQRKRGSGKASMTSTNNAIRLSLSTHPSLSLTLSLPAMSFPNLFFFQADFVRFFPYQHFFLTDLSPIPPWKHPCFSSNEYHMLFWKLTACSS